MQAPTSNCERLTSVRARRRQHERVWPYNWRDDLWRNPFALLAGPGARAHTARSPHAALRLCVEQKGAIIDYGSLIYITLQRAKTAREVRTAPRRRARPPRTCCLHRRSHSWPT
jgi:hypothetical protein